MSRAPVRCRIGARGEVPDNVSSVPSRVAYVTHFGVRATLERWPVIVGAGVLVFRYQREHCYTLRNVCLLTGALA